MLGAGFFVWGVSPTHPVLASLCGEFLLHILCWLLCVGSFSYTSCAGFFGWGVSLTCTVLASWCGEFLLHIPCWLLYMGYFSYISMLASLCWLFLLHILCWLYNVGSFTYKSHAGCIMWELLLHIPWWILDVGSFSYMFPGGWWLLYTGIFSYTSDGCAYHTNCLSKQNKQQRKGWGWGGGVEEGGMISLYVGVSSLKKKINNKFLNSLTHLRLAPFFMMAERHPNCQPPHSLHVTTQTQILPLYATSCDICLLWIWHTKLCNQINKSTTLLYQLLQRLKLFTSDLPWWHLNFNQLAPFILGL